MSIRTYTKVSLALAGFMAMASARAQITLAEGLTATGFVDMSVLSTDTDAGTETGMGLDQWEIDFTFDFEDAYSATVDVNDVGDGVEVEQAYITADLGSGFSAKAGLFLSALGYEGAEPIFLWQYSVSATIIGYPGYSNGAALSYGTDAFSAYVSVLDGSYSQDGDADEVSVESQLKFFPMEGLTIQAGYASEKLSTEAMTTEEGVTIDGSSYDQGILNFWVEYATGPVTLAAEYNSLMEIGGSDGDGDGYLVMLNYALTDKFSITFRHSGVELDDGYENTEFTISPSYVFSDHLFGLLEFRTDDFNDDSLDGESYAAELVYTF